MAGLGSLFNYDKPGPGVDKDAPKKKGFKLFWGIFCEKFWKIVPLNFLYILCCIPIVTVGFADVGLTYVTRNFVREKPVMMMADFFDTIKKNWKQALIVGLANTLGTAILLFGMWFYFMGWNESFFFQVGLVVSGCAFIVFSFLKYYINFLVITFKLKFKQLYKNSLLLSSAGLKANVIITASIIALAAVFFVLPFVIGYIANSDLPIVIGLVLAMLFVPATVSMIIQFNIFPVIKQHMIDPYYANNPKAAKRDKALLNIFEDEDEEEEKGESPLFKDLGTAETPLAKTESTIPKQYSKRDIKRIRRQNSDVDDDTI